MATGIGYQEHAQGWVRPAQDIPGGAFVFRVKRNESGKFPVGARQMASLYVACNLTLVGLVPPTIQYLSGPSTTYRRPEDFLENEGG